MSVPYYPMYPADFEADTSHLTLEEDGAYNRLLRLSWMTPGCSLPDDDAWIARRMRVDAETFERVVAPILSEFFERRGGRVRNRRLSREYEKADETYRKRSAAGKRGGRPKAIENNEEYDENCTTVENKGKNGNLGLSNAKNPKTSTPHGGDEVSASNGQRIDFPEQQLKAGVSRSKAGPKQPEPEPYSSVAKATAADAANDPVKVMFDGGVRLLSENGISPNHARSMIGKWRKDHGTEAVIAAIGRARRNGATEPLAFIEGILKSERIRNSEPRIGDTRQRNGFTEEWRGIDGWMRILQ